MLQICIILQMGMFYSKPSFGIGNTIGHAMPEVNKVTPELIVEKRGMGIQSELLFNPARLNNCQFCSIASFDDVAFKPNGSNYIKSQSLYLYNSIFYSTLL